MTQFAFLITSVSTKIKHVPAMHRPDIRSFLPHLQHMFNGKYTDNFLNSLLFQGRRFEIVDLQPLHIQTSRLQYPDTFYEIHQTIHHSYPKSHDTIPQMCLFHHNLQSNRKNTIWELSVSVNPRNCQDWVRMLGKCGGLVRDTEMIESEE